MYLFNKVCRISTTHQLDKTSTRQNTIPNPKKKVQNGVKARITSGDLSDLKKIGAFEISGILKNCYQSTVQSSIL